MSAGCKLAVNKVQRDGAPRRGMAVAHELQKLRGQVVFCPTVRLAHPWLRDPVARCIRDAFGIVWAFKAGSLSFAQDYREITSSHCVASSIPVAGKPSQSWRSALPLCLSLRHAQVNEVAAPRQHSSTCAPLCVSNWMSLLLMLCAMVVCSVKLNVSETLWHSGQLPK